MDSRRLVTVLWTLSVAGFLALCAVNLWMGDLNQDEGWYLYAARLVAEGKVPYADFAFTQGPVMPYVYAVFGDTLVRMTGVVGGRLFTAILGFFAAAAAAVLASRLVPRGRRGAATLMAFMLIALNVYQSYFTVVVKTYSLCAMFLALGFLALSLCCGRRQVIPAMLAGVLLALAGGTRISALVTLPVVCIALFAGAWRSREHGKAGLPVGDGCERGPSMASVLWFIIGGALACCVIFVPFFLASPDNTFFGLVEYHSGRVGGGAVKQLIYKAGFISRLLLAYIVPVGLGLAWLAWRWKPARELPERAGAQGIDPIKAALWISILAMTLVHFLAPFPYDDYQVALFPLFAAGIAGLVTGFAADKRAMSKLVVAVFLLTSVSVVSSPMNQALFVKERDRIWWRIKEKAPLARLRQVGAVLKGLAGPDHLLLTQDTYLAVEAGLRVPEGLELGPFSYYPAMDDETAARRHVVNAASMRQLLSGCDATVAAFSGYGLSIRCPEVAELSRSEEEELWNAVLGRYRIVDEVSHFGQALTTLKVLVRNEENPAGR